MGNGYEHSHHTLHHYHYFHRKTIFFPIFCRLSIKDIKLNNHRHKLDQISDEPSSPKVSCMGQVKRNNRTTAVHHKYSKLKRLFSTKTILLNTTSLPTTKTSTCTSSKEILCVDNKLTRLKLKNDHGDKWCVNVVNVKEFDPPLPVVKRVAPPQGAEVNIWKRRFNGVALKGLQIEQIHNLPKCNISQPPTV